MRGNFLLDFELKSSYHINVGKKSAFNVSPLPSLGKARGGDFFVVNAAIMTWLLYRSV